MNSARQMTSAPTVERECPGCGSAVTGRQEYCLECGSRLPADAAAAGLPRRRLGPGGPAWTLLATGVVALIATAMVFAVRLDEGEAEAVLVATSPQPTVVPTAEAEPVAEALPETERQQTTRPSAQRPRARERRLVEWPAGESAWTVVIASLPAAPGNRAVATRQAREALDSGLPQVGVLTSSGFSSLHPGYLVVFSGIYENRSAAEQAVSRARAAGQLSGYTREIVP